MTTRVGFAFEVRFADRGRPIQGLTWESCSEVLLERLRAKHQGASGFTVKMVRDRPVSFPLDWSKL